MDDTFRDILTSYSLTDADWIRAQQIADRAGSRLPSTLVRLGLLSEQQVAAALAQQTGSELLSQEEIGGHRPSLENLNANFFSSHSVAPCLALDGGYELIMADPGDEEALAALAFALDAEPPIKVATFSDVEAMLSDAVAETADESADLGYGFSDSESEDLARLLESGSSAPVIRLVQQIFAGAINRKASDIHIEPMARQLVVRYRIDGRLVEANRLSDQLTQPIASRLKVMAGLDIGESRLPQDGRLRVTVAGRDVDVRMSTSPTAFGESIVLRLLGRSTLPLALNSLGLPAHAAVKLIRALERPHGIILLTGPTGSGKTTTLYAAINHLRRPEVKILTVEDPVEVLLEGVNQVQVRPEIDLSYAKTLRAFLRQDPDILMIGEIRDLETAEIALRAALTGHLVLSTLHTNSALGAFPRLSDIGIEPYLAASTVIATIAQRLVRALCVECRTSRDLTKKEVAEFESAGIPMPKQLNDPSGCPACLGSGYAGRIPLIEVLEVDDPLRGFIREGSVEAYIDQRPPSETLRGHGLALVAAGKTTFAEVDRAVQLEG